MNTTDNKTLNDSSEPKPAALLWFAVVHCYCVCVIGTLGNALALWCVGTCAKTQRPVKVLLFSVFLPALLVCLVTRPVVAESLISVLTGNRERISLMIIHINSAVYSSLASAELISIAAVAVVRVVSVLYPHVRTLEKRGASLLVTAICLYSGASGVGLEMLMMNELLMLLVIILFFINTTLPVVITAIAYILMIVAIQRNKRRLAASQQQAKSASSMDQATRAMLAVFLSNLVFGVPHTIYHLMGKLPRYIGVIFHVLYSTHFIVDPLVFVWFNNNYRTRVRSYVQKVTHSLSSQTTSSTVQYSATSQSDNRQHHSSPNRQVDTNV